jgi:hypothetical protein
MSKETPPMDKPAHYPLLPGVETGPPPQVVFRSQPVIVRARRRAVLRDVLDLLLLASVDGLFIRWPGAHVPAMDRVDSLLLLVGLNAAMLATMWLSRAMPRWKAQRVAATWCPSERARLNRR